MEQLRISVIVTYAELIYGVERSSSKRVNRPIIEDFIRHLEVMAWDTGAADSAQRLCPGLRRLKF